MLHPNLLHIVVLTVMCLPLRQFKSSDNIRSNDEINAAEVIDKDPIFGERFYKVYYTGSLVVYQNQYQHTSSVIQMAFDSVSNEFTSEEISSDSEMKNRFLCFIRIASMV